MLEPEHRFGFAVAFLLLAKRAQGEAAIMPDQRRRAERNLMPGLLDPPAEINVIPGLVIFRIEPTDAFKRPAIPGHVAPWNVFGHDVRQQDVTRPAGSGGDAGLHPVSRRRRNIWAPHPGKIAAQKRAQEVIEPIRIGHAVGVGVGENFAFRDGSTVVPGVA